MARRIAAPGRRRHGDGPGDDRPHGHPLPAGDDRSGPVPVPRPGRRQPGEARRPGRRLRARRARPSRRRPTSTPAPRRRRRPTTPRPPPSPTSGPNTLALEKAVDGYIADALKLERPYTPGLRNQGPARGHDHHLRDRGSTPPSRWPTPTSRPTASPRSAAFPARQVMRLIDANTDGRVAGLPRRAGGQRAAAQPRPGPARRPAAARMSTEAERRKIFTADIVVPALWAVGAQARPAHPDPQPRDVRGVAGKRHHDGGLPQGPRPAATTGTLAFTGVVALWLWLTVLFANLAEAIAEGRGKAQANALRATRSELMARLVDDGGAERLIPAAELHPGDTGRVRGRRPDPGRRRRRRGRRLGGRVGDHRRVGPRDPRVGRRPQRRHRRHARALRPHRGAHHPGAGRELPRPHDRPRRGHLAAQDAQRDRPQHPHRRALSGVPGGGRHPAPAGHLRRHRGRLGAAAAAPRPGRHRARQAASGRHRRDAAAQGAAARARPAARLHQGGDGAARRGARSRAARRLHPRRRHGGRGRAAHPAQPGIHRRGGRLPAPAFRARPSRLRRALPDHAEAARSGTASSRRGSASSGCRARRSRPTSPPANGRGRPAATPSRGAPAPSSPASSAPTPTSSGWRSTRRWRSSPARATRSTTAGRSRRDGRSGRVPTGRAARGRPRSARSAASRRARRPTLLLQALREGRPEPLAFRALRHPGARRDEERAEPRRAEG